MTATRTVPAGAVGINPVIVVSSTTRGGRAGAGGGWVGGWVGQTVSWGASWSSRSPPMVTSAAATAFVDAPQVFAKPVPLIVTFVPPGPEDGVMEVMVGRGAAVKTNPVLQSGRQRARVVLGVRVDDRHVDRPVDAGGRTRGDRRAVGGDARDGARGAVAGLTERHPRAAREVRAGQVHDRIAEGVRGGRCDRGQRRGAGRARVSERAGCDLTVRVLDGDCLGSSRARSERDPRSRRGFARSGSAGPVPGRSCRGRLVWPGTKLTGATGRTRRRRLPARQPGRRRSTDRRSPSRRW